MGKALPGTTTLLTPLKPPLGHERTGFTVATGKRKPRYTAIYGTGGIPTTKGKSQYPLYILFGTTLLLLLSILLRTTCTAIPEEVAHPTCTR